MAYSHQFFQLPCHSAMLHMHRLQYSSHLLLSRPADTSLHAMLLQGKPGEVVPKLKQDLREAVFANWK